jgi:hypothetical protein
MAALLAGQGVTEVAEAHNLPVPTVSGWAKGIDFEQVRIKKGEQLADLTFGYLTALLSALTEQVSHVRTKEYVSKQPASEIAVLHGVMADKAFRLLSALPTGEPAGDSEPVPSGTEGD